MIEISIQRHKAGHVKGFEVSGHANFDEYGRDIVCCAISVLAQTAIMGLVEYVGLDCKYEIKDGYLLCRIPEEADSQKRTKIDAIVETMILGMNNIKQGYPSYVTIECKEV